MGETATDHIAGPAKSEAQEKTQLSQFPAANESPYDDLMS
jgi:hypothetical protein